MAKMSHEEFCKLEKKLREMKPVKPDAFDLYLLEKIKERDKQEKAKARAKKK